MAALDPEPPWWTPRKATAPRRALSRQAIVAAALGILRAEGMDAVSMRRVASELGTGPASLYAHVANKDELLELLYDELLVSIPTVEPAAEVYVCSVEPAGAEAAASSARHSSTRSASGQPTRVSAALRLQHRYPGRFSKTHCTGESRSAAKSSI